MFAINFSDAPFLEVIHLRRIDCAVTTIKEAIATWNGVNYEP